tara:strand:- start:1331 stop:2296 length:966 start_codon:yes stop_codon:yes gene_type:complete
MKLFLEESDDVVVPFQVGEDDHERPAVLREGEQRRRIKMTCAIFIAVSTVCAAVVAAIELFRGSCGGVQTIIPAKAGMPNVLLVIVDDLRADLDHTTFEAVHTPNLMRFAQGPSTVTLDNAYVQIASCNPSRNSFLTGRRPNAIETWNFKTSFRDVPGGHAILSLPQAFKEQGYASIGQGKVYHYDRPANNDQCRSWSAEFPYIRPAADKCDRGTWDVGGNRWCAKDDKDSNFVDGRVTEAAIERIYAAANRSEPFFMAVGFRKPHADLAIPRRYLDSYDLADDPGPTFPHLDASVPDAAYYQCSRNQNQTTFWDRDRTPR